MKLLKATVLGLFLLLGLASCVIYGPVKAQAAVDCGALNQLPGGAEVCKDAGKTVDCPDGSKNDDGTPKQCPSRENSSTITAIINIVVNYLFGIIGAVIVLIIIISGIQMAASAGNPDAIKGARERIVNAVIGLVLLISMYGILRLIGIAA